MRAELGEPAPVEHGDAVGHPHGGEPVLDQHGDAALALAGAPGRGGVALEELVLRGRVEGGHLRDPLRWRPPTGHIPRMLNIGEYQP